MPLASVAVKSPASAGEGKSKETRLNAGATPIPGSPAQYKIGVTSPCFIAPLMPAMISSLDRSSSSKYFSIKASSPSAAASTNTRRASSASSAKSAGISPGSASSPRYAFILTRSITPLKVSPSPIGNCTLIKLPSRLALMLSRTRLTRTFSRSILLIRRICGTSLWAAA